MQPAALPENENQRLESLETYEILNSVAEPAFDDLCKLAAMVCGMPYAMINFIGGDKQWVKSVYGAPLHGRMEVPRINSICAHTIYRNALIEIENGPISEFKDNPLFHNPFDVVSMASQPVLSPEGLPIGTLCVGDTKPRKLTSEMKEALLALASQITSQLQLRLENKRHVQVVDKEGALAQGIMSSAPFMMGVVDVIDDQLILVTGNRATELFLNLPMEKVRGTDLMKLNLNADFLNAWSANYKKSFETRRPSRFVVNVTVGDRSYSFRSVVNFIGTNEEGYPRFTYIAEDFSAEKQLEGKLNDERERLALGLAGTRSGLWDVDCRTGETYLAPYWKQMLGYSDFELETNSETFFTLVHPDDRDRVVTAFNDYAYHRSDQVRVQLRMRMKSGEYRWLLCSGAGSWDESGNMVRITGWNIDIHEHVLQSERLAEEKAKLEMISAHLKDCVYLLDATTKRAVYASAAFISLFEVDFKNLQELNETYFNRIHPDDLAEVLAALNSSKDGSRDIKYRLLMPDGRVKWTWDRSFPIFNADGSVTQILGITTDITESQRNEEMIKDQQMKIIASAKLSSLGEMAGGIAHEINNPLAVIAGRSQQLMDMVTRPDYPTEKVVSGLEKILATANRIAKIVKGLRTFSRTGDGDPLVPSPLSQVVEDTLGLCAERFRSRGVELRMNNIMETSIECRSVQISQVLLNLLNNAFDAVNGSAMAWVEISTRKSGNMIEILVTDSGPGIPRETAEKMMMPFFTTKKVGEGTGLGLSISQGIAKDHGGQLDYDYDCANTRFILKLPLHVAEAEVAQEAPKAA